MMRKPTIGVVVTTFNGEVFIQEQLESILNQTLKPDLIVIVDDRSTDSTPEIIESYSSKYNNILLYHNERNIGYIRNFEKGIYLCNADYIALCDQDDIWFPEKLEKCYQNLNSVENGGLCYHNASLIYEDGTPLDVMLWELSDYNFPLSKDQVYSKISDTRGPISGFTMFFHEDLKQYILPIFGKKFCGHDWWITAVSFFLFNPICVKTPLTYYRMHLKQASGTAECILKNTKYRIKKKVLDPERVKRNIKREIYRLFFRKRIKTERERDEKYRKIELAVALQRLVELIEASDLDGGQMKKEDKISILQDERRKILLKI